MDRTALQDSVLRAQSLKRANDDMRSRIAEVGMPAQHDLGSSALRPQLTCS
jgi:hypothetical protein